MEPVSFLQLEALDQM